MAYDILIRNGTIIDGSGAPAQRGDVGIKDGRIAALGKANESASKVIDADGLVVSPGFIDGHTHMDAQIFWDPLGTGSSWHGVTSVVMGNCGITLAPCRPEDRNYLMDSLQAIEDIPARVMKAGLDWSWGSYRDYLKALDRLPKGINYCGYIGHTALRRYVMGERASTEKATADDIGAMRAEVADAIQAGAMGFSTSRAEAHATLDGSPLPSRVAAWEEVQSLVRLMGEMKAGIFEVAGSGIKDHESMHDLALETGVPMTFGLLASRLQPGRLKRRLDMISETVAAGGRMFGQAHTRALTTLWSFKTTLPYDHLPVWNEMRKLPLPQQRAALADPLMRAQLVEMATRPPPAQKRIGGQAQVPNREGYRWVRVLRTPLGPNPTLHELAQQSGKEPVEIIIDMALESDFEQFFMQEFANEDQDAILESIRHPDSVVTFSDSGAHVSQIVDCCLQSHFLAWWVREKQALSLEAGVRKITWDLAKHWGLADRGLLKPGMAADVVVFDPKTIGPVMPEVAHDLPAGGVRLIQRSQGVHATIVNGVQLFGEGSRHSGDFPGRLLRGPLAQGRQ